MSRNNTDSMQKIDVTLLGQRFTVRSDRDESYLSGLSKQINEQVEEIRASTKMASPQSLALLAALNMADQLARTKEALSLAEERLFFEKKEFEDLKEELIKKAQSTLQEVETALSYLPDNKNESGHIRKESDSTAANASSVSQN